MTWLRIEDGFAENPKVLDLSDRAFRLHVAGLCYSARNLTDGFLSVKAVRVVCAITGAARKHVVELRDAELWLELDDGYEIKDFLDYNPDSEAVRDRRAAAAERQRRWRDRSRDGKTGRFKGDKSNDERNAPDNALRNASRDTTGGDATPSRPVPSLKTSASYEAGEDSPKAELVPFAAGGDARTLVAAFVDEARKSGLEPPRRVVGHLAAEAKRLLDEGQSVDAVAAGMRRMVERRIVQPSLLANFVMEAQLPSGTGSQRFGRGVTTEQILDMAARAAAEEREAS